MDGFVKNKELGLPWHAFLLGGVFLLYSLAAGFDYIMSVSQGETYYKASGMTESQINYFLTVPIWAVIGWSLSVWGGLLGSVGLLLRYGLAGNLFLVSLVGTLIYILYVLVLSEGREAMGQLWFMPIVMALFTAVMCLYCLRFKQLGVLG
ncbi:hypothetical protein [Cellvibrio sp. QJXJ]|uniref:hypothetical protein n=1 Tax=Cellvibrio sp. QJXJ TaxID=2964606 RepID=UPI0021C45285|nr:hypothetical protein [Cellvibrio sp. QJXJ]UUA74654.1 hypothetical protein NNX04_09475 [Cellvibrio sp. QJXJ]